MFLNNTHYQELATKYGVRTLTQTYGERMCKCGKIYNVKYADLSRGWGLHCSKSCAAKGNKKGFQPGNTYSGNSHSEKGFNAYGYTDDDSIF